MNVDLWQIIIGIGQIIAVAIIPLITWGLVLSIKIAKPKRKHN